MRLLLIFSAVALAQPSWKVVTPIIVSEPPPKLVFEESGQGIASIAVRVRFTDTTTPVPRAREKDYTVSGTNALDDLKRMIYRDRETLESARFIVAGNVTPAIPSPKDTIIETFQISIRRLSALDELVRKLGLAEGDQIGTSGVTVAQIRTLLRNTIKTDLTNQARVLISLDNIQ